MDANTNSMTVNTMTVAKAQKVICEMTIAQLMSDDPFEIICSFPEKSDREILTDTFLVAAQTNGIATSEKYVKKMVEIMRDDLATVDDATVAEEKEDSSLIVTSTSTAKDVTDDTTDIAEQIVKELTLEKAAEAINKMEGPVLNGKKPIELICQFSKEIDREMLIGVLYFRAKECKINMTKSMIKQRIKAQDKDLAIAAKEHISEEMKKHSHSVCPAALSLTDIPMERMITGPYNVSIEDGVVHDPVTGSPYQICPQAVLPLGRLYNPDTGNYMIKIAFINNGDWTTVILNREVIANNKKLTEALAAKGLAINEVNAKALSSYIIELEQWNIKQLPQSEAVSVLGWADEKYTKFVPYINDLTFVGNETQKTIFSSINENGDYNEWLRVARVAREQSVIARIALAASFASVLLKPNKHKPMFVHLWGKSGGGKTVLLLLCASIWANPQSYILTFNSTTNSIETNVAFLNNLPACIDELQTAITNGTKDFQNLIYNLCEGLTRGRLNRNGDQRQVKSFSNSIITTGEEPITGDFANDGALNRIMDIHLTDDIADAETLSDIYRTVSSNYGFAGKQFLAIFEEEKKSISTRLNLYSDRLISLDIEPKQALIGAFILLADHLSQQLYGDGMYLCVDDVLPYLRKKTATPAAENILIDLYSEFETKPEHFDITKDTPINVEEWGYTDENYYYLYVSVFTDFAKTYNFKKKVILAYLSDHGLTTLQEGESRFSTTHKTIDRGTPYPYKEKTAKVSVIPFAKNPPFLSD